MNIWTVTYRCRKCGREEVRTATRAPGVLSQTCPECSRNHQGKLNGAIRKYDPVIIVNR